MEHHQKKFNTPTIFVIFGGTGDLARKKLFPSLYDLYRKGRLPDRFFIVGVAHSDYTHEAFRDLVMTYLVHDKKEQEDFLEKIVYVRGSFDDENLYNAVGAKLQELDDQIGQCSNKLFHLSVSPKFYNALLNHLAASGLAEPCDDERGWTRVLIEKPFGSDLESAQKLDALLGKLFREEQIYRIDHYLAKETVQNITMFRFANMMFVPIWNDHYIQRVELSLHETIDVGTRGNFYDGIGALRDVGQNHLLQMFSLIAMDNPSIFDAEHIRRQRASVLERTFFHAEKELIKGQYEGYRSIEGVDEKSQTETYFRLQLKVDSDKWRDTQFVLSAGKMLEKKSTCITIILKEPAPCLCEGDDHAQYNKIIFEIQPEEKITVRFFAKAHGFDNAIVPKDFTFNYHDEASRGDEIDAYERVLYDAVVGDQVLFASTEEVVAAWKVMNPILEQWNGTEPILYKGGSNPEEIGKV